MSFRRTRGASLCAALAIGAVCSVSFGHQDDGKVLDRVPRYEGPGYRAALRGAPPINFPSNNVALLSWIPLPEFGQDVNSANSCWGHVSPAGREYAIIGTSRGTAFVDVTNPGNAQIVAQINGPESLWRDMKTFTRGSGPTYQAFCYSISEGGDGIQVIDISNIDNGVVTHVRNVTTGGNAATHTIAINEDSGYLYRAGGGSNGLRIYNLNVDPANPSLVATWTDRYVHECQVVTYTSGPLAGQEIVLACSGFNGGSGETGLEILNVTNKSNIVSLSRTFWPEAAYSHQVWLSPDRQYAYLNDELDEDNFGNPTQTEVFDMSNPAQPVRVGNFTNGNSAIGHNLYTRGNFIYEANYRSGLRVFDATNPIAPVEVASFDTWPSDDNASFNGLWNNYPYLPSGIVIGSDIEKGLFVWYVGEPQVEFSYPDGLPSLVNPAGMTVRVQVDVNSGTLEPGSLNMTYSAGTSGGVVSLAPLGGNLYNAVIPALPCGSTLSYYFSAETTNNIVWRGPSTAPAVAHTATVATNVQVIVSDTMETNTGWTGGVAGDTAESGQWVRVNPRGTAAQPEDDHTPAPGVNCWVTGQGSAGGSVGGADVDNGFTTLLSPLYDLSAQTDAVIGYWRWYSNDQGAAPNADVFVVDVSRNNGSTWTNVETVGPAGPQTAGGWFYHEFALSQFGGPTAQVRLRFIASDLNSGSIVEAAIDDFGIRAVECAAPPCPGDLTGDGLVDLNDLSLLLANFGCSAAPCSGDLDENGSTDLTDLSTLLANFGVNCN